MQKSNACRFTSDTCHIPSPIAFQVAARPQAAWTPRLTQGNSASRLGFASLRLLGTWSPDGCSPHAAASCLDKL